MNPVLYVDDEPALLEIAKLFLEETNEFVVDIKTSAQQGLDLLKDHSFEAIISDYQMPEMDGIAFLKEVRERFGDIPFILFTGRGREEVVIEAINNGADFYLQKGGDPTVQFAELAHKIRQAVARRQAERSLINSEKRLADIINFLPDATFAIDRSGTVIAWNRAIEEMTGIPAADMRGKRDYAYAIPFYGTRRKILIDLIFEPDDVIARNYTHIIHEKDLLIADTSIPRPKGTSATLMGKASPLYDQYGEIVGAIESIRDITQREQDAKRLAQKTSTLSIINRIIQASNRQQTIDDYTSTVLSLTLDHLHYDAGGIYFANPGEQTARLVCTQNLGPEFILEIDNIDIRTAPYDDLFIRGEPVILENLETVLPHAAAVSGLRAIASIPIVSQDHIIGALNVASREQSVINPDDREILLTIGKELGSAMTRIKAELALRESEGRLRLFIQEAPAALAMFDLEMRYLAASRRWMGDYHLGDRDIIGISHYEVFPHIPEELKTIHRRSLAGEILSADEDRFEREDGSVQWLAWEVRPWYITGKAIGGIIIFSEDITERKRTEEALRESEERLDLAVDASNDGLFDWDVEKGSVYYSPRYFTMLGYTPGEFPAAYSTWTDLLHPDDRERAISVVNEYHQGTRESHEMEFRLRAKNGDWRWILSKAKITGRNTEGKPVRMLGTHTDITEWKHAEREVVQARDMFRTFVDHSYDAIFISDLNGRVLDTNATMLKMYQVTREEALRLTIDDFSGPASYMSLEESQKIWNEVLAGKDHVFPWQARRPRDGSLFDVEVYLTRIELENRPVILANVRDVTDRKRAEEAFRQSEEEHRNILENMLDAYFQSDRDGNLTMVSPSAARIFGYDSPGEMMGIPAVSLYNSPEQREDILRQLQENGKITDFPVEARRKDGRTFWASMNAQYILDKEGRIIGAEGIVRDITERKSMEQALLEANRKLNLLSSITRHDVINQLAVLRGYTRIATMKKPDPVIADLLAKIDATSLTISRQIEFTKIYQNLGIHTPCWFRLEDAIEKAATQEVKFSNTCKYVEIFADPMFERVFFNLFDNAIRHGERVTEIIVRCERAPDGFIINVEDNGIGIPSSEKKKIFEKGYGKNTGFGLFLAREILAITGITISEIGIHGTGARFEITVPKSAFRFAGIT
ncbi:MAG: PAS domain S-box protein [Methanoregula sp.]|jgi:PAS domain S-box-containing protein|nr:PAS domain S-box protein [Methanoregula sp.]